MKLFRDDEIFTLEKVWLSEDSKGNEGIACLYKLHKDGLEVVFEGYRGYGFPIQKNVKYKKLNEQYHDGRIYVDGSVVLGGEQR